jgi:Ca2+-binding EF-hand superfamily protein
MDPLNTKPNFPRSRQFKRVDEDGNHQLDFREFKQAIHQAGIDLDPDQTQELFDRIDTSKNGTIDFEEFLVALRVSEVRSFC